MLRRRGLLIALAILAAAQALVFLKCLSGTCYDPLAADPSPARPRAASAAVSDRGILEWVREDNYAPLRRFLERSSDYAGYRPDLDFEQGFDDDGFAHDGSGWRAVRYAPLPGPAGLTQAGTHEVYVRLPEKFRSPNSDYHRRNFEILEAAITTAPESPVELPATYTGAASDEPVRRALYPPGTEFLQTVRYFDPGEPTMVSRRMKELRYAWKAEAPAKGWLYQGFIEDSTGRLRLQTREEHRACLGCHSGAGDREVSGFAFARKVPGSDGWRPQDLRGIPDVRLPSREAALELDKSYRRIVLEQSFLSRRDLGKARSDWNGGRRAP